MRRQAKLTSSLMINRDVMLKRRLLAVFLIGMVSLILILMKEPRGYELVIRDQQTNQEYFRMNVLMGDQIELSWIHSVEKTPWHEKLVVDKGKKLRLVETRFKSFGAGVPHETQGHVHIRDGYTVMTGLNQEFSAYRWIHSHQADFHLSKNSEPIVKSADLPHHHAVEMIIKSR